ncbi:MAG: LCP family protein [Ilumatobacteraceae bacterium]|nr:LCP family protein [Ilumatobacteraceae bacterium]
MHTEIAATLVAPGWAARERRRSVAIAMLVVGVGLPLLMALYVVVGGRSWVALTLDREFLGLVVLVGCLGIAVRLAALVEVWLAAGRRRSLDRIETAAAVVAMVGLIAGSVAVVEVGRARAALAPTFTATAGEPLFDPDRPVTSAPVESTAPVTTAAATTTSTTRPDLEPRGGVGEIVVVTTTTTTLPPKPAQPDSGVSAADLADVTTVLLLGGDAGPGRGGLRTDSMMLFSLHRPSGRAALISIPRNLERLLFPPGSALESSYPYGFGDIANAVYPIVSSRGSLRDAYAVGDIRPGVVAIAQGIGYSLDVKIDDYVLVDMQGFLDLIDAIGGVTLTLTSAIPMPGNVPGARTQYPDTIGPGVVQMDGSTALGYARSRKGDNDYRRARRQRDLLAALAQQVSLTDVALSFGSVAAAIGGTLRTSLTPDELTETLNVIGGETAIVESVGLVPPLVDVRRPDYDAMAKIVGAVHMALVTGASSGY